MLGRRSLKLGTPWVVSLVIHLTLVGMLALVALRVAMEPAAAPERYMEFDDAGAEPMVVEATPSTRPTGVVNSAVVPTESAAGIVAPALVSPTQRAVEAEAPRVERVEEGWFGPAPLTAESGSKGVDEAAANEEGERATRGGGEVKFAGLGSSNARSVVYVVDASGPMVSSLREVVDELERSVSRLSATQRFGVVAFGRVKGGEETRSFMPVLVRATPQAKKELHEWLAELAPAGRSNPLSGLRAALKLKSDAVFLLSRGIERSGGGVWELGLDPTMEELDRLNPVNKRSGRRNVVVKTIQFLDEDPTGTMQRIGQLHGASTSGTGVRQPGYRVVRRGSDLMEASPSELEP